MISIIYSTNRINPMFTWFIDSLCNQTGVDERKSIEIVFIDYLAGEGGRFNYVDEEKLSGFANVIHTKPKTSLYQGIGRRSKTEMFSAASCRNTGVILSNGEFLVFVDDVSILMPSWWGAVWQAYVNNRITCGSYWKQFEMVVDNGNLVSSTTHEKGKDSRWNTGRDSGPVVIPGTQLFGCSLAIPAYDIMAVNGFDELCDSIGGEDYQFGVRLNNSGRTIYYDRKMFTIESEELHNQHHLMLREDRVQNYDSYMNKLSEFSVSRRLQPGARLDSSHMILDILYGTQQKESRYNYYRIDECRAMKKLPAVPNIEHHWFDNKPLAEL